MTKYIVLVKIGEPVTIPGSATSHPQTPAWAVVGTTEAQSADVACQWGALEVFKKTPRTTEGRSKFVAVPERSFQPVEVTIDPNPKASIAARVSVS